MEATDEGRKIIFEKKTVDYRHWQLPTAKGY
jgi:hypothetical protein